MPVPSVFEPQRVEDSAVLFTDLKQTAVDTARADGDLNIRVPLNDFTVADLEQTNLTDAGKAGLGQEHPTTSRETRRVVRFSITTDLGSRIAGTVLSFFFGKVTTTGVADPFTHVFTEQDPAVSKHAPATTVYIQMGSGLAFKFHGLTVNSIGLGGRHGELLPLTAEFIGIGFFTQGTIALPALTSQVLYSGSDVVISVGNVGASADVSDRIASWSFNANKNVDIDNAYFPGSGVTGGRIWIGRRTYSAQINAWVDASSDLYDRALNRVLSELKFDCQIDANDRCEILLPEVRFSKSVGSEAGKAIYQLDVAEEDVYKTGGATPNEPAQATLLNEITAYLQTA